MESIADDGRKRCGGHFQSKGLYRVLNHMTKFIGRNAQFCSWSVD